LADERPPAGRVRPTGAGALVAAAVAGLVGGWMVRLLGERINGTAPLITWGPSLALLLVAVILAWTAFVTARQIRNRRYLAAHQAVNRLVLAKSCALAGALVSGGYAGYALSWLGADAELAGQRALRSLAAALAALAVMACSLWLERACRVPKDDSET
jgi:heme A synthase